MADARDGDALQIIAKLRDDLDELTRTYISRWGRVPSVAADPASPPDGAVWIRSDTGVLSWRANGVTSPSLWTAVTVFTNSWVNFDANHPAQYRKVGDDVELRGLIKSGTIGLAAFTLPAGFRPFQADEVFAVSSNSLFGRVVVLSTGVVTPDVGSNITVYLSGIRFSTIA